VLGEIGVEDEEQLEHTTDRIPWEMRTPSEGIVEH